jgi:hypothetical protein
VENALDRYGLANATDAPLVTLGGQDEQMMWDLWRARSGVPSISSVYVPRMVAPLDGADVWGYAQLNWDATDGVHDLAKFIRRAQKGPGGSESLLEWIFTVAARLAFTASGAHVTMPIIANRSLQVWQDALAALRRDPMGASSALAEALSRWFHAKVDGEAL